MEIIENQVYNRLGGKSAVRLLRADHESDLYWVIDLQTGFPFSVDRGFFSPTNLEGVGEDPFETSFDEKMLSIAERKIRDKRYASILPLIEDQNIFDSVWRRQLIKQLVQDNAVSMNLVSIERALRQYWVKGCVPNALLPEYKNCGAPGKDKIFSGATSSISDSTKQLIKKGFWKFYAKNSKATLRQSRIDFMASEDLPAKTFTFGEWVWWGRKLNDALDIIKARAGKQNYDRNIRTNTGTSRDGVFGPYSEVMIDSTIDNVRIIMIEAIDKYIGRLCVYFAVDVFSGAIVGMYVSPAHPSYVVGSLCLVNMVEDKVEFGRRYGVDESTAERWPPNYLPKRLLADRGEFISNMSSSLPKNLKIDLSNTPTKRPDLKAYVEIQFRLFQERLKSILADAGYVDKKDEPRVTPDTRKQACLTFHDMVSLIIREVVHYNNYQWMDKYPRTREMINENVRPIPLEILNWGLRNGCGNPVNKTKITVWRNALPVKTCRVLKSQIDFKGHSFRPVDPKLNKLIDKLRFEKASCEIAYNPMNFKQIYLRYGTDLFPLTPFSDTGFENFYELDFLEQDLTEQRKIHERVEEQAAVAKRKHQIATVAKAKARRTKTIEVNQVRENKAIAIQQQTVHEMSQIDPESAEALVPSVATRPATKSSKSALPSFITPQTK